MNSNLYIIFALVAMVGYGINAIIYKIAFKNIDPISLALFTSLSATTLIFLFWIFIGQRHITADGLKFAGIAGSIAGIAVVSFIYSVQTGQVSTASTIRGLS